MRIVSWLITVPLLLLCALFAVNNRQDVTLDFWPTGIIVTTPLYIVTLGMLVTGFFFGALLFWLAALRPRWQKRQLQKQVDKLKHQLAEEKAKAPSAASFIPPQLP